MRSSWAWRFLATAGLVPVVVLPQTLEQLLSMPCPNLCSGHGWCDSGDRRCKCYGGFAGADCSLRTCPYAPAWADDPDNILVTDVAHNSAECARRGICNTATGQCVCSEGWEGAACERKSCSCSGRGKCASLSYYASLKDPGLGTVYAYDAPWDAMMMFGCACDSGFGGYDCSLRHCPAGDDPMTTGQVTEKQALVCTASSGYASLGFGNQWTTPLKYSASAAAVKLALDALTTIETPGSPVAAAGVSVTLSSPATTWCHASGETTATVSFLQNFGKQPLLQVRVVDLSGGAGSITVQRTRTGTKENVDCSNRGVCDAATGVCECSISESCGEDCYATSDGFGAEGARGDCGAALVDVEDCPGEVACSGFGYCDESTFSCQCHAGYSGADCSQMTCPFGKSWFSTPTALDTAHSLATECSDMGVCNRDYGECECSAGFEGASCNYMSCPGADRGCSGHGDCLSMALLAERSELNGVATQLTYGATPNDNVLWDWDAVRGCDCADGWTHYDCSARLCPFGDDPLSHQQINEIQLVNCDLFTGSDAAFKVTFREQVTVSLNSATVTLAQLEAALEQLDTVFDVSLAFGIAADDHDDPADDPICSKAGTDVYVTFLRPTGDVPLLEFSDADTFAVSEYAQGDKEWEECSGRGLCDRATGVCQCFPGFGSSDGQGNRGPYRDCGGKFATIDELQDHALASS